MHRRAILQGGAALSGAALLAELIGCRRDDPSTTSSPPAPSSGGTASPLPAASALPTTHAETPLAPADRMIELASGFTAHVVDRAGDPMSDGLVVPGAPDGMATFARPDGLVVLMRNHELSPGDASRSAYPRGRPPEAAYDKRSFGGVSRVVVDPVALAVVSSNLVLAGTNRNCSCGAAPFGFLTCEEDDALDHGWVFLCDPAADRLAPPRRIEAYGRFYHESIAVDPTTHVAYMTEDLADGVFYRFVPTTRDRPFDGRLEALAVDGEVDTMKPGETRLVRWISLEGRPGGALREVASRAGATRFRRGEGMFLDQGATGVRVHFCVTAGGPIGRGQVFTLAVDAEGDRLTLVAASTDAAVLDMPDNVVTLPGGTLLVCEDASARSRIRGITPSGKVFDVARSLVPGELTGITFAAGPGLLFVNLQLEGATLVVRGPFDRLTA